MANEPDHDRAGDPLEAIARSLANLESLCREEIQRREEDRRRLLEREKQSDEAHAKLTASLEEQTTRAKGWKGFFWSDHFAGLIVLLIMLLLVVTILILAAR